MSQTSPTVALVTGASSGIGAAIAQQLHHQGFTVWGTSRSPRENSQGVSFVVMDVCDDASVNTAVTQVLNTSGRIDVLVNAAGLGIVGAVEEVSISTTQQVFDTNVFGLMRVCQAVLPTMRTQTSGLIINISSIAGMVGLPFRGIYAASKFAVEGLSESMALELHPFGIRVTMIQPGGFKTQIAQNRPLATPLPDAPYAPYLEPILEMIDHEVSGAPGPAPVGKLAARIAKQNNPTLRYPIGKFLERFTPVLKRWLPWKIYAAMIRSFHKL